VSIFELIEPFFSFREKEEEKAEEKKEEKEEEKAEEKAEEREEEKEELNAKKYFLNTIIDKIEPGL
jgi:FtsZ-interacting cell division protein YlmF